MHQKQNNDVKISGKIKNGYLSLSLTNTDIESIMVSIVNMPTKLIISDTYSSPNLKNDGL